MKRLMALKTKLADTIAKQRAMLTAMGEHYALSAEEKAKYDALDAERADIQAAITQEQALFDAERAASAGAGGGHQDRPAAVAAAASPFRNLGEFLLAVAKAKMGDEKSNNMLAAAGQYEGSGADGGWAVGQDFIQQIVGPVYDTSQILKRCKRVPISSAANSVKYNVIEEVSKANGSRFGAVQAYWAAESATVAASQVKLRKIELELKKLFALGYATDELLQDAAALEAIMVSAFRTEIGFRTEDSVYRGTGDGMPLGIMKSPSLITQAIEGTQTIANTNQFIAANVAKMLSRVPASLWGDLVFLMTPELLPYLVQAVIGTNGVVPVFLPPNGLADSPMGTILGRPAIFSDYCEAVGTPGDIMAAALSQYALADKASEQVAQSMHVRFLTDEMTYRVTYRVDGQPEWRTALTPYKGGNTRS